MLVRFKSVATGSITMFGDVAVQLIRMLGASGTIPGAISAGEIPQAAQRLREHLQTQESAAPTPNAKPASDEDEVPVALSARAVPLLDLLARAAAANADVMWERA